MMRATIVKLAAQATMPQVNWLTRREQLVLAMLLGLFIVGWTVKVWRAAQEPEVSTEVIER